NLTRQISTTLLQKNTRQEALQPIGSPRGYISRRTVLPPHVGVAILPQSLTRAALIGAATVRERFPQKAQNQAVKALRQPLFPPSLAPPPIVHTMWTTH